MESIITTPSYIHIFMCIYIYINVNKIKHMLNCYISPILFKTSSYQSTHAGLLSLIQILLGAGAGSTWG